MVVEILPDLLDEDVDDFRVAGAQLLAPRAVGVQGEPLGVGLLVLFAGLDVALPAMAEEVGG